VPGNLDALKYEVAEEIGYVPRGAGRTPSGPQGFRAALDSYKYEVAAELGIPLQHGDNGDLTSREAGRIGGRLGGRLGGQMVRRLIEIAERQLAGGGPV